MQFTVAQRRWKWSHEKETLPCNSGSRPQVGSDVIHCETTSVLISLPSSSLLLLVFTDMHTDSVFSGPSVSLCALLPFWRQKRKRGSPVRRDHSRVWSLRLRYTNHSGTFQSQGRPQVIPLNTHSFRAVLTSGSSSVRHCGRPLWTRAGRLYIGLWQAHHLTSFFLISRRERKLSTQIFFPLPVVLSSSPFILPVCSRLLSFRISEGRSLSSSLIVWVSREEIGRA